MNLLRGTLLSILLLCFVLAVSTAFANGQDEQLKNVTGEVQKKMIRYEEPKLTNETAQKDESNVENAYRRL